MKFEELKNEKLLNRPYKIKAKAFGKNIQKSYNELMRNLLFIFESHGELYALEINNEKKEYTLHESINEEKIKEILGIDYDQFLMLNKELNFNLLDVLNNNLFHMQEEELFNFATMSYVKTGNTILVPADDIILVEGYFHDKKKFIQRLFHPELEEKKSKKESLDDVIKKHKVSLKPSSSTDEESADGVSGGRVLELKDLEK